MVLCFCDAGDLFIIRKDCFLKQLKWLYFLYIFAVFLPTRRLTVNACYHS